MREGWDRLQVREQEQYKDSSNAIFVIVFLSLVLIDDSEASNGLSNPIEQSIASSIQALLSILSKQAAQCRRKFERSPSTSAPSTLISDHHSLTDSTNLRDL